MAKNFYRVHKRSCKAGQKEGARNGEFEERKKGWKRCDCSISVSGVFGSRFQRKSTGTADWEEARQVVLNWKDTEAPPPALVPPPAPCGYDSERVTVEAAVASYKNHHRDSAHSTRTGYGYLLDRFQAFSDKIGYVMLDQWRPGDFRQFRDSWGVNSTTENRYMAILKAFFEYAVSQEFLKDNTARKIKRPRNRNHQEDVERIPFTDLEVEKMFHACEHLYCRDPRAEHYAQSRQDLSDFIAVSVYTGLRISDVATFHIDRLQSNGQVRIRTIKRGLAGNAVYTWVPEWLQARMHRRALQFGPYIFGDKPRENTDLITDKWRRKLQRLWSHCGPWEATPTPHRFRHTFVRILLQMDGVAVRDVAELIGDTEEVIRKHYSAWVTERQDRLTHVLQQAFKGKAMPDNVVDFPRVV